MIKAIYIILFLILTALVIAYIDNGIRTHNLDFYFGKDNGFIVRLQSIIILNVCFYLLLTIGRKQTAMDYLKQGGIGFATAIILGVVGYLIFLDADSYGLTYHIATIVICFASYFGLKKITGANKV